MAEAMFRDLVEREGLANDISVDSAGTGDWHVGKPPHEGTRGILEKYSIDSEGLEARKLTAEDLEEFDYIIGMDAENINNINKLGAGSGTVIRRMLDFVEQPAKENVPDPYFTGDFDETYELVKEGCEALLREIKTVHQL
jgi:protein-tyrosine phosphatase